MNIYQKLIEVRKSVPYLQKEANGPQFKYVSSSQVLASCKAKMDELGLLLIPSISNHLVTGSVVEQKDKDGNVFKRTTTYFTELEMLMTWVNAEKPDETVSCTWYGQGVDIAGEKGVGKALTYAEKYFMLKFFNIPTDKDDPDSFQKNLNDDPEPPKSNQNPQKNDPPAVISEPQQRRLFAISKDKEELAKAILAVHGYDNSKSILKKDYDAICKEIEQSKVSQS